MNVYVLFLALSATLAAQVSSSTSADSAAIGPSNPVPLTKPEDRCSIEGQVVSAGAGEPIRKATLMLRRADVAPAMSGPPTIYTTTTDATGKFAMKDLDPGKYRLSANRSGFIASEYGARASMRGGTTLSLSPGQRLQQVDFRLIPHGVITGRVLDEDGETVASVSVQPMIYRYAQGRKQLMPVGGAATNDLGEYRIFGLAPGRYLLRTSYRSGMFEYAVDRSAAQQPDEDYVPTYYPGSTDPASAQVVEITPGAQLRGIDIRLSKIHTLRIRGHVTNATGGASGHISVSLMLRGNFFFSGGRPSVVDSKGNFEIRGVAPGSYNLMAHLQGGDANVSVSQPLDIGNNNVENVNITLSPPTKLTGHVRVEGSASLDPSAVRLLFQRRDTGVIGFGPTPAARVQPDGSFTAGNASPGHYTVALFGQPGGYFVKLIRAGDKDVLDGDLDLTSGPLVLEIVLSPNAGQLAGSVQNSKQDPAPGATVVLIPQEKQRRDQQQYYKTTTTDQYGHFTLKDIAPGEYKVFAWEDVEIGAYMDPDFIQPVENRGESVAIRESSRENVQLRVIPAEDLQQGGRTTQESGR